MSMLKRTSVCTKVVQNNQIEERMKEKETENFKGKKEERKAKTTIETKKNQLFSLLNLNHYDVDVLINSALWTNPSGHCMIIVLTQNRFDSRQFSAIS